MLHCMCSAVKPSTACTSHSTEADAAAAAGSQRLCALTVYTAWTAFATAMTTGWYLFEDLFD